MRVFTATAISALCLTTAPFAARAQSPSPSPAASAAPAPAASAAEPVATADPAIAKLATSLLAQAQSGKVDRSQFDATMNAALTSDAVASVAAQLAPLGAPKSIAFRSHATRGNLQIYSYRITWSAVSVDEILAIDPDGKLAGWLFRPASP